MELEYHKPGVYLHMPEAEYHADPSLGSSDLKRLLISPRDYWTFSQHNPRRPPKPKSEAMELGTAMHVRILMGKEVFDQRYAPSLDADDYPQHLKTVKQLEERCKQLKLKSKSGTIAEMSARIKEADPDALLWSEAMARHRERIGDREMLDLEELERIEDAALAIETSKAAVERLRAGRVEVSLFWRDEEFGTPLKARIDALRLDGRPADLKSFSNPYGRDLEAVIGSAMSRLRYPIQAVAYTAGLEVLRDNLAEFGVEHCGPMNDFAFVFVQTGYSPNILIRTLGPTLDGFPNPIWTHATRNFRHAVGLWRHWSERKGFDRPWVDAPAVEEMRPELMSWDSYDHEDAQQEIFV